MSRVAAGRAAAGRVAAGVGLNPQPIHLAGINAAWLSAALAERYRDVEVVSVRQDPALEGTATKVRVHLEYNRAGGDAGLPPTLMVKGGFGAHRDLMAYIYQLEARFYRDLAPALNISVPACFYAACDVDRNQAIVILEDLDARGAQCCRVESPLNFQDAAAQLSLLAACHARWWNSKEFDAAGALAWVEPLDPLPEGVAGSYQRGQLRPEVYAHYMGLPRGVAVARMFHDRNRMERAMEQLRVVDRAGPFCLLHGDAHLGNLYFDRDRKAGLLDWQSVRKGPWAHDVTYLLISSLDMLDRRAWEAPLLRHYLAALSDLGVDAPSFDEAWHAYRQQIIYGLYYWLVNPIEFQLEVNNCAVAARFALAAVDHAAFDCLRV